MPFMRRHVKTQIVIAMCVDIAHILVGSLLAWSAPIIPKLQDPMQTPLADVISVEQASWLASASILSALIGPFIASPISNRIGRKYSLILAEAITLAAMVLLTFAFTYEMILAARLISGLSEGMIIVTDVVYIGEIASPRIRGMLLSSTGMFHCLGILLMYSVGPYLSYRNVGFIFILLSLLHLFSCMYIPESQMFYAMRGNNGKARSALRNVRGSVDVEIELNSMLETINKNEEISSYKEIFTVKSNRKAFFIVVMLCLLQDLCGVVAIIHYSTTIFQLAKSSVDPNVATIVVGVTQFTMSVIIPGVIDKFGRRTMLMISTSCCGVCMTLLGVYFYFIEHDNTVAASIGWLPLLLVVLFYCGNGAGISIIPNTIVGEMFNPRTRTRGSALSMTIGWAAGYVLISSFGYIVEALGGYVLFFAFAFVNCFGFIFTLFVVPETKGLTLIEIQTMLEQ